MRQDQPDVETGRAAELGLSSLQAFVLGHREDALRLSQ